MGKAGLIILAAAAMAFTHPGVSHRIVERCFCLRHLATAEDDFRSNDRSGNPIVDFWTLDVTGLYELPLQPCAPRAWMASTLRWMAEGRDP